MRSPKSNAGHPCWTADEMEDVRRFYIQGYVVNLARVIHPVLIHLAQLPVSLLCQMLVLKARCGGGAFPRWRAPVPKASFYSPWVRPKPQAVMLAPSSFDSSTVAASANNSL